ncbi:hypothetical protein [Streptomyces justiciae]|nr:hypothetical protein [Streptomyces justiciae]MCW8378254.1 hypothetical protein [Streptomyces justiciae]
MTYTRTLRQAGDQLPQGLGPVGGQGAVLAVVGGDPAAWSP